MKSVRSVPVLALADSSEVSGTSSVPVPVASFVGGGVASVAVPAGPRCASPGRD